MGGERLMLGGLCIEVSECTLRQAEAPREREEAAQAGGGSADWRW